MSTWCERKRWHCLPPNERWIQRNDDSIDSMIAKSINAVLSVRSVAVISDQHRSQSASLQSLQAFPSPLGSTVALFLFTWHWTAVKYRCLCCAWESSGRAIEYMRERERGRRERKSWAVRVRAWDQTNSERVRAVTALVKGTAVALRECRVHNGCDHKSGIVCLCTAVLQWVQWPNIAPEALSDWLTVRPVVWAVCVIPALMPSLSDMKVVYDLLRQRRQPQANYHQMDGQNPHPTNGSGLQCSAVGGAPVPTGGQSCASEHIISIDSIHINKELGVGEFGVVQQGHLFHYSPCLSLL